MPSDDRLKPDDSAQGPDQPETCAGDRDLDPRGTMSFGDHLDELRRRVIWCVLALALVFCVLYVFREPVIRVVVHPVRQALTEMQKKADAKRAAENAHKADAPLTLSLFGKEILRVTVHAPDPPSRPPTLYLASPQDAIVTTMSILGIVSLFIASPFIGYQLWAFIGAGLYPREKRFVRLFAPMTVGLFILGMLFTYFVMLKVALPYLIGFVGDEAAPLFYLNRTATFIIGACLIMGLVFQIPLVVLFLVKIRLVTTKKLAHYRGYCYFAAVVVGALLTPPDVGTQILMAGPMILLFEFGLLLGRWAERADRAAERETAR